MFTMDFPKWFTSLLQRNARPDQQTKVTMSAEPPTLKIVQLTTAKAIDTSTVFTGPKGGKYRLNSKGKKVYLSA